MTDEVLIINTEDGIIQKPADILPIYTDKHQTLRQKVPIYTGILPNQSITNISNNLIATLKKYNGVGLTANQCGINIRMFVMGTDQFQITCINPEITNHSIAKSKDPESSLSFPGLILNVPRYNSIEIKYLDLTGTSRSITIDGLTAKIFQQQLDQLNGIVFTDYFVDKPVALRLAKNSQKRIYKKITRKKSLDKLKKLV